MSNELQVGLSNETVQYIQSIAKYGFLAYGKVYASIKSQIEEKGQTFSDEAFWEGQYTTKVNNKGVASDTLDSQAKRIACSTFDSFNPKTGRAKFVSDEIASLAWTFGINKLVRGGIRSESDLNAALEANHGDMRQVILNCIQLGRIAVFAKRVARAFGLHAKTSVKVALSAYDAADLYTELKCKLAVIKTVDDTVTIGGVYDFVTDTLRNREKVNKAVANGTIEAIPTVTKKGKKVA